MCEYVSKSGRSFFTERDLLEVTRSGIFGGPADETVRMIPGPTRYYIDGEPVSREEAMKQVWVRTLAEQVCSDCGALGCLIPVSHKP